MVRTLILGTALLALSACDDQRYTKPIELKPHGEAVRQNMQAHIIDPTPPDQRPALTDANRPVLAVEAYRTGEVEEPSREDAAASTASVNN
ncbi:MAG: hypothetical protein AAF557_13945 [Pseudomonadota bacterium]